MSHVICSFHRESERVLGSLNGSLEPLVENVLQHRQTVDAERRSLHEAAASLRSMLGLTGTRDVCFPVIPIHFTVHKFPFLVTHGTEHRRVKRLLFVNLQLHIRKFTYSYLLTCIIYRKRQSRLISSVRTKSTNITLLFLRSIDHVTSAVLAIEHSTPDDFEQ